MRINEEEEDSNLCCGTHVSHLGQLASIKIVSAEVKKGKVYVYFLVGDRVIKYLSGCIKREQVGNIK